MSARPAAFIDRDGTLIEERSYPVTESEIVPIPGAGHALRRLSAAGYLNIILTNQSAVARGMLNEERLDQLHDHLARLLAIEGGEFDDVFYCPHHPEGVHVAYSFVCSCRKPASGLLEQAMAVHDIDLSRSVFIGDSPRDLFVDAGPVLGRILVSSGHPLEDKSASNLVTPTIVEAVDWIVDGRMPRTHPRVRRAS
jgi:D-glycero-D-manno-heptose 1,7-bisphosphate phosphatase